MSSNGIHPFYTRSEDFRVDWVAEVSRVDLWCGKGVSGGDVHAAAGEGVFETHEQGKLLFSLRRGGEELGLVGALGHVEAARNAERLQVGEICIAELIDYELFLSFLEGGHGERVFLDGGDGVREFIELGNRGVGDEAHHHPWATIGTFLCLLIDLVLRFLELFAVEGVHGLDARGEVVEKAAEDVVLEVGADGFVGDLAWNARFFEDVGVADAR